MIGYAFQYMLYCLTYSIAIMITSKVNKSTSLIKFAKSTHLFQIAHIKNIRIITKMYHHFTPHSSHQHQTMTQKLQHLLIHYQHQQILKPQNQCHLLTGPISGYYPITIESTLSNQKHNCMMFSLSNDKLLRYDFKEEVFQEIEGFKEIMIKDWKVIDIGETQRYVIDMCQGEIVVLTLLKDKKQILIEEKQEEKSVRHEKQPFLMQQENPSKQIYEKPLKPSSLAIKTIKTKLFTFRYSNIISQGQNKQLTSSKSKQRRLRSSELHIVKDITILTGKQSQLPINNNSKQVRAANSFKQTVFLIATFNLSMSPSMYLAVFQLTVKRNMQVASHMNKTQSQFMIVQQGLYNQTLEIAQLQFPNHMHFMQLAMTFIDVPFDTEQQSQTINPLQITQANSKFLCSKIFLQFDLYFVKKQLKQSDIIGMFSFYCVTQSITHQMEPQHYRHNVFEFRLGINLQSSKIILNETWGSPIYHYPQRQVICPAKVYCLPQVSNTSILCYINVTKTIPIKTTQTTQLQPNSYKFTTVNMFVDGRMQFSQIEPKQIENEQQSAKHKYQNILGEEHKTLSVRLNENIIFGEMLLLDMTNKYAIMWVREQSIKVSSNLNPNIKSMINSQDKLSSCKIVVVNLRQTTNQNFKRVASQFFTGCLDYYSKSYIYLACDSMKNTNYLIGQEFTIQTSSLVWNNSLNYNKTLEMLYCKKNAQIKQGHNIEMVFQKVDIVPKAMIYCDMMGRLFAKGYQENKEEQTQIMEEKARITRNGIQPFLSTIIDLLGN